MSSLPATSTAAAVAERTRTCLRQQSRQQNEAAAEALKEEEEEQDGIAKEEKETDGGDRFGEEADQSGAERNVEPVDEFSDVAAVSEKPQYMIWLEILRFVKDLSDLQELEEVSCLVKLVQAERESDRFRRKFHRLKQEQEERADREQRRSESRWPSFERDPDPIQSLDISDTAELFYEWGADKAAFGSVENFETFCRLCGVDPAHCIEPRRDERGIFFSLYHWMSPDKKLVFSSSRDPRSPDSVYNLGDDGQIAGVVHYFGLSGLRSRAKTSERWFHDNADWEEMCHGGRDFC